jgi:Vitamin-D-receptor interacting Mediator subunit 4
MTSPHPETLLEKTQAMIELERLLTITMEKVEPWLASNTMDPQYASSRSNAVRVRPIPTTMGQVEEILAVARNLSTRTSAPAGWNPNAPVVGFSTPNPLPHQLRGGALAALELQQARQQQKAEQEKKKRKRQEEVEEKAKKLEREEKVKQDAMDIDKETTTINKNDPKAADAASHRPVVRPTVAAAVSTRTTAPAQQQQQQQTQQVTATTMNLSDSSSSEDDDDDESD